MKNFIYGAVQTILRAGTVSRTPLNWQVSVHIVIRIVSEPAYRDTNRTGSLHIMMHIALGPAYHDMYRIVTFVY